MIGNVTITRISQIPRTKSRLSRRSGSGVYFSRRLIVNQGRVHSFHEYSQRHHHDMGFAVVFATQDKMTVLDLGHLESVVNTTYRETVNGQ